MLGWVVAWVQCAEERGGSNEGTHHVTNKHCLQVCTSFREAESASVERRQNCAAVNQRHKAWIRAVTCQRGLASWRPIKLFRGAAQSILAGLDNQLRTGTAFGGLSFIQPFATKPEWRPENWRKWPGALQAADQGGDGVCATNAML